jgi:hypothetical protein
MGPRRKVGGEGGGDWWGLCRRAMQLLVGEKGKSETRIKIRVKTVSKTSSSTFRNEWSFFQFQICSI